MKRIVIAAVTLILCAVCMSAFAQNTWTLLYQQENPLITEAITLNDAFFTDANNGWACGTNGMLGGGIFKTTDGGTTWENVKTTGMFDSFSDFEYVSDSVMWAAGTKGMGKKLLLYKTTDGGATWEAQPFPEDVTASGIHFKDENTGWVFMSKIYKTSDGGASWSVLYNGVTNDGWTAGVSSYSFIDDNNIWAAGSYGHTIHTMDGGETWNYVDISSGVHILGMSFVDADNGWLTGGSDIMYTNDGGATWSKTELDLAQSFQDIHFIDSMNGWAAGGQGGVNLGMIYSSTDGGKTWVLDTIGSTSDLKGMFFLGSSMAWAYGANGTVQQYIGSGGPTAVDSRDGVTPEAAVLSQNAPNPFNPETSIRYYIPESGRVSIDVFSLSGQKIRTLADHEHSPGYFTVRWDGRDSSGDAVSSGIYMYRLKTASATVAKKMLLMR